MVVSSVLDTAHTWASYCDRHNIDMRLTKAIEKLGFEHPTKIQTGAIAAALGQSDVLMRAHTGSGKTVAYLVPMLHNLLLQEKSLAPLSAVVLVPSKELCSQVLSVLRSLLAYAFDMITVDAYTGGKKGGYKKPQLPHVLVSTPEALKSLLAEKELKQLANLKTLIVDEADAILSSTGTNEETVKEICSVLPPSGCQNILVSATLTDDLSTLNGLMLHNPKRVEIEESLQETATQLISGDLTQFYLPFKGKDKYLVLYGLLRLQLIKGKVLIFVNTLDNAYKLKLFLTKFYIPSGILNPSLPVKSRQQVLSQFNEDVFNLLIATDADHAYRGLDFSNVQVVLNFDMPRDVPTYIHRVGRTARGGNCGLALTLVDNEESKELLVLTDLKEGCDIREKREDTKNEEVKDESESEEEEEEREEEGSEDESEDDEESKAEEKPEETQELSDASDDEGMDPKEEVKEEEEAPEPSTMTRIAPLDLEQLELDISDLQSLRYRVEDVVKGLSRTSVAALKQREILSEALNSEKLKNLLEEGNEDTLALKKSMRTLKETAGVKSRAHLKFIPSYLLPSQLTSKDVNTRKQAFEQLRGFGEGDEEGKKRKPEGEAEGSSKPKKRSNEGHRARMLRKEPKGEMANAVAPEALPPIAGRKLWKLQHGKRIKKRSAARVGHVTQQKSAKKRSKRFDA